EPRAVREIRERPRRELERETGLAAAADAAQRQQPRAGERRGAALELRGAPDEAGELRRQVVRDRGGRRAGAERRGAARAERLLDLDARGAELGEPALRILVQTPVEQRADPRRRALRQSRAVRLVEQNPSDQLVVGRRLERARAGEALVEHAA